MIRNHFAALNGLEEGVMEIPCHAGAFSQSLIEAGAEPFLVNVRDKPFAVVPYTLHMNDIVDYETRYFSTAMYADDLKAEFDALYAEAGTRRRMMSVTCPANSLHLRTEQRCE
jgi:hypothetical protein